MRFFLITCKRKPACRTSYWEKKKINYSSGRQLSEIRRRVDVFIYTQQLQVGAAGPDMLPGVVSVRSFLFPVPIPCSAPTSQCWMCGLGMMVCILCSNPCKSQGVFLDGAGQVSSPQWYQISCRSLKLHRKEVGRSASGI